MAHNVEWKDRGREPRALSDPRYPNGIDVDMARDAKRACLVKLPYPPKQKRIGMFMVSCDECGLRVVITTAGRPDDPRSVKLACKEKSDA